MGRGRLEYKGRSHVHIIKKGRKYRYMVSKVSRSAKATGAEGESSLKGGVAHCGALPVAV